MYYLKYDNSASLVLKSETEPADLLARTNVSVLFICRLSRALCRIMSKTKVDTTPVCMYGSSARVGLFLE
jgi:hypothetical protein